MMNKRLILTVVVIAVMLLAGCTTGGQPTTPHASPTDLFPTTTQTPNPTDTLSNDTTPWGSTATITPSNTKTTPTDGLQYTIRVTLISRFDPGTTFGMPTVHTNETIESAIEEQPQLAKSLSQTFNTSSQLELFTRLEQYNQIRIDKNGSESYAFSIKDGNACTITTINGTYHDTGSISAVTNSSETVPC